MKGDILRSKILSEKIIPNMNEQYRKQFPIPEGHRSLGIFTAVQKKFFAVLFR